MNESVKDLSNIWNTAKDDCANCKYKKTIQEFSDDYIF